MALYTIGDLHLHFQSPLKAQSQRKERVWKDHEARFQKNCAALLGEEDTLVLAGDHSWGRNLDECEEDFRYLMALPGRKILLRGNHDMFWDANKTEQLNARFAGKLHFLQNNYFPYRDYALVGTKGYTFEGPFYLDRRGRILGWDEKAEETPGNWWNGSCSGSAVPLRQPGRSATASTSSFSTTRPPAFWRRRAVLPPWPRNTARSS